MLETIERKAETMQKLVADFYDLLRLTARDYEVEMKAADVGRILREALMDSYQMLEHQKLELDARYRNMPSRYLEMRQRWSGFFRICCRMPGDMHISFCKYL